MAQNDLNSALGVVHPTQIIMFRRCPEQWRLRYIERRWDAVPATPALVEGNAVHSLLASFLRSPKPEADEAVVRKQARVLLERAEVHRYDELDAAASSIADSVTWCLSRIDDGAETLAVEQTFRYQSKALMRYRATLAARVDLVIRHADGSIEHLDWKTGTEREDDALQAAICRMVVGATYPASSRGASEIRTTTRYTQSRHDVSFVMSHEHLSQYWRDVLSLIHKMATERVTTPKPGPLCRWCPFLGNGCSLPLLIPNGATAKTCLGKVTPLPSC